MFISKSFWPFSYNFLTGADDLVPFDKLQELLICVSSLKLQRLMACSIKCLIKGAHAHIVYLHTWWLIPSFFITGADEAAVLAESCISGEHALTHRPSNTGHEHHSALHEGQSHKWLYPLNVADPGSGAFLTLDPGSGIGFPDPGFQTHIFDSLMTNFWVKRR